MSLDSDVQGSRSPRYPRYPLLSAIGYAKRLYDGAHRSTIDTLTAYKVMGFAGKSGASATALGAARQFGLVEGVKGGVRVSSLGLAILEPASPIEYDNALREAAYNPPVFKTILERFEGNLPRSDEAIRSYLIRALDFSKKGADECVNSLRETVASMKGELELRASAKPEEATLRTAETEMILEALHRPEPSLAREIDPSSDAEVIRLRLTKQCTVELRFSGHVSDAALSRLIRHIELMKDAWDDS